MKTIITPLVILFGSLVIFAQNPGQAGTLMPNTVPQPKNKNYGGHQGSMNYYWNYNYNAGYAEVFIRIPENGVFTVTINNQSVTTNTGRFRFFDLQPGPNNFITIQRNGYVVYKAAVSLQNNRRYIIDYFTYQGMYLLNTIPLNMPMGTGNYSDMWDQMWNGMYNGNGYNNNYGQNWNPYYGLNYDNFNNGGNWNQQPGWNQGGNNQQPGWNHGGNNQNPGWNQGGNNQGGWNTNGMAMNPNSFAQFKSVVKSQSFDNSKVSMIKQQANTNKFTSSQIKELCDLLSFDKDKLETAKFLYDYCVDRQNYFNVYPTFDFDNSVNELTKYISGK